MLFPPYTVLTVPVVASITEFWTVPFWFEPPYKVVVSPPFTYTLVLLTSAKFPPAYISLLVPPFIFTVEFVTTA